MGPPGPLVLEVKLTANTSGRSRIMLRVAIISYCFRKLKLIVVGANRTYYKGFKLKVVTSKASCCCYYSNFY